MRRLAMRFSRLKVRLARRNILRANPRARIETIFGDFIEADIASKFIDCDYLFLAADAILRHSPRRASWGTYFVSAKATATARHGASIALPA
jgi:hypothetical protein